LFWVVPSGRPRTARWSNSRQVVSTVRLRGVMQCPGELVVRHPLLDRRRVHSVYFIHFRSMDEVVGEGGVKFRERDFWWAIFGHLFERNAAKNMKCRDPLNRHPRTAQHDGATLNPGR